MFIQLPDITMLFTLLVAFLCHAATPLQSGVSYWQGSIAGSNEGDAGYSFYENIFNLFQEGYPLHTQMGLAAVSI